MTDGRASTRMPAPLALPGMRSAGILLHVTSLPSRYGLGDFGPAARAWIDRLASTGLRWWQVLPLNPPADGACPYQCFSAFAGNPALISPEDLVVAGLLRRGDLPRPIPATARVAFNKVLPLRQALLDRAFDRFDATTGAGDRASRSLRGDFDRFCHDHAHWLDDFALFMALRQSLGNTDFLQWPRALRLRHKDALASARRELAGEIQRHRFVQFLFFRQFDALRAYARGRGVGLMGDIPIFVAGDSADVWAHPDLFLLDRERRPRFVAGVPPDYFSRTGQRWGNPHYDWDALARQGYRWWIDRLRASTDQFDLVRLDHFRGFAGFWRIPASAPTAQTGRWVKGPGIALFDAFRAALAAEKRSGRRPSHKDDGAAADPLPLIAEDLGVITPDVVALRQALGIPGMRVLQFAFGGDPHDPDLPHNHEPGAVVYTGTHDNDTTAGWYASLRAPERRWLARYAPPSQHGPVWTLIRLAWSSPARLAIIPFQDLWSLGGGARMNIPGTRKGNWQWRALSAQMKGRPWERLAALTETFGRRADGGAR